MKKILSLLVFVAALLTSLAAKAEITIYVQKDAPFTISKIYAFGGTKNEIFGGWPGSDVITQNSTTINGTEYYYVVLGADIESTNIIFNNGSSNAQTKNITNITETTAYKITGNSNQYDFQTVSLQMATPVISCAGNLVSITCADKEATIYYTIDGEEPNATNGFEYTKPFKIEQDCTVKAIAVREKFVDSNVASQECTFSNGITIYVKKDGAPFTINYIYAWVPTSEGNKNITASWPGDNFQGEIVEDGITFVAYTFDEQYKKINILFTQGDGQPQTVDITDITYSTTFEILSDKEGNKYKVNTMKTTGIESIAEDAEETVVAPEYYNLQGIKIANPENGLYIKRIGNKTEKVYIR